MAKTFAILLLIALGASLATGSARAQNATGLVVSSCGVVPSLYVASRPAPFTVDTNGNFCIGTGGSVDTTLLRGTPTMTGWSVSTCGNQTFKSGNPGPFTVDLHGNLCN